MSDQPRASATPKQAESPKRAQIPTRMHIQSSNGNPPPPTSHSIDRPLFILAPPRSFTSVICAILGQHPQMYGLPEMHLFGVETVGQWWRQCVRANPSAAHGPLRAVAQLVFGDQTELTICLAREWLQQKATCSTGFLFKELGRMVAPRILVDKSPSIVRRPEFLDRVGALFPAARFLHLVRHPRGQGESVLKCVERTSQRGRIPRWLRELAWGGRNAAGGQRGRRREGEIDPQLSWYQRNAYICDFLRGVPPDQKMQVRGEDILSDPDHALPNIVRWLGLREDPVAIEEMKHPERSPYACLGPRNARSGNDRSFLQNPSLRSSLPSSRADRQSLEGPLSWRPSGFLPKVKRLAVQFGYD